MTYKILYVEDQDPDSIIARIKDNPLFEVIHIRPKFVEEVLNLTNNVDLVLLDFKLTIEADIKVDAPTIATALRTYDSESHKDIPIFLISTKENITNYYKDFSSKDLFDLATTKSLFLENVAKYTDRFISAIDAYKVIATSESNLSTVLGISEDKKNRLDYRLEFNLKSEIIKNDVFAYSNFILQNIIRSIGLLIGEDVLSARLGVSIDSPDWNALKEQFSDYKYKGIYSKSYNRWWASDISMWFKENQKNGSLRRMDSYKRCEAIKKITDLKDLYKINKIDKKGYRAKSSNFWTVCKDKKLPIDYIDGFEIYERELFPWQEKEYISFLGKSSKYSAFIKPSDNLRIKLIEDTLK